MIKKQRLFKPALNHYKDDPVKLNRVNWILAEYLDQRGYTDEAAYTYLQAGDLNAALETFTKSQNVEMVFSVAT